MTLARSIRKEKKEKKENIKIEKSKRKNPIRTNQYANSEKNSLLKNWKYVWKSIKINYFFWFNVLLCVWLLTYFGTKGHTYFEGLMSFLFAIFIGYFVHYISHAYDFEQMYDDCNFPPINYMKSNKTVDNIVRTFILYTFDFHDKIHHDSSINKKKVNILVEFFQNILTEGGLLIIFALFTDFEINLFGYKLRFNKSLILLWGILYATVHNINYLFQTNSQHVNHHKDPKTNYALDTIDILFDTKYDLGNIENLNWNWGGNIIIITLLMIYFKIAI